MANTPRPREFSGASHTEDFGRYLGQVVQTQVQGRGASHVKLVGPSCDDPNGVGFMTFNAQVVWPDGRVEPAASLVYDCQRGERGCGVCSDKGSGKAYKGRCFNAVREEVVTANPLLRPSIAEDGKGYEFRC